eukprot:jgi/Ulvmu1/710/UM010_0082.1
MQTSKSTNTWIKEILYTFLYSAIATVCAYALLRYIGVTYWPFYAVLGIWVSLEILFFAVQRLRYHRFNRVNRNRPDAKDIEQRFQNFLTLSPILDIRDFISGWFLNIPFDQIRAENVSDFIAYAYWYRPRHELTDEEQIRVERYTAEIARAWDITFPTGSNPELQLMGHLWEPLKVVHKPLFVHIASEMSMLLTHLALLGLKFERYECMGFTYWASGLERPMIDDHAEPVAAGRLSVIQSVLADLRSLLQSDGELPSAPGPLDFFTTQAQGFAEYQQRLKDSLAAIMRPDALSGALPVLPDFAAGLAALSERLPTIPSMASLPRLPSMAEFNLSSQVSDGVAMPMRDPRRASAGMLAFPSLSNLSRLPAFRDLDDMGHFDDLLGAHGPAVSLPSLSAAAAAASAAATAARGSLGSSLGSFHGFGIAAALRESLTELRVSFSDLTEQMSEARVTLMAALPVMNLPDWHLPDWGVQAPPAGAAQTWRQRLGGAITRSVEWAELDALFAGLYDIPAVAGAQAVHGSQRTAARAGAAPGASANTAFSTPPSAAAASAAPGIIQAWVESARDTLARGVATFSGFSLPAPSELLELWPQGSKPGRSLGRVAANVPTVDPDAAAALRRRIEGEIITRSASGASLDKMVTTGKPDGGMLSRAGRERSLRRSGVLPAAASLMSPGRPELPPPEALSRLRQRELRRRAIADRRGLRRVLSDPGPIFPKPCSSARLDSNGATPQDPAAAQHAAADVNGHAHARNGKVSWSDGVSSLHDGCTVRAHAAGTPARPLHSSPSRRGSQALRHSLDVLCTPPRGQATSSPPLAGSPSLVLRAASPVRCSTASSDALPPLPLSAHGRRGPLPAALSPALREPSGAVPAAAADHVDGEAPGGGDASADVAGRPEPGPRRGREPIVFLHGVGFGVFPYLGFVWKLLRAFPGRPFVLLEVRSVSLRLCMRAVGVDDVVRALAAVLRRHRVPSANFVGHSFGTFVVAHMRKLFPETVSSVLLCDPVCMLTCFPKLLYNFIYRGFSIRDVLDNPTEAARWLAARDLTIAATFCRHFWWHTLMLWPWELPEPSVLVLSTKDALVPSELVRKQLRSGGVDWESGGQVKVLERSVYHGHFLFMPKWQDTIVETFQAALREKEERDAPGAGGAASAKNGEPGAVEETRDAAVKEQVQL